MFNYNFSLLLEASHRTSTINAVVDIINRIGMTHTEAAHNALKTAKDRGSVRSVKAAYGRTTSRLFSANYIKYFESDLRNLESKKVNQLLSTINMYMDPDDRTKFSATHNDNLGRLVTGLPQALKGESEVIDKALKTMEMRVRNAEKTMQEAINIAEGGTADSADSADTKKLTNTSKDELDREEDLRATQDQQANTASTIVNDVLDRLPVRHRKEIKHILNSSPNKLQTLMIELQKRNIKL